MRALLCPIGSRGDAQPLIALAIGLRKAGHDVAFAASPNLGPSIVNLGFAYRPVGSDIQRVLDTHAARLSNPIATLRTGLGFLQREVHLQTEALEAAAEGADLLVGLGLQMAARTVSESRGIAYLQVLPTPQPIPSASYPPFSVPAQRLPGWMNGLCHIAMNRSIDMALLTRINEERGKRGLAAIDRAMHGFLSSSLLLAVDDVLVAAPRSDAWEIVQTPALIHVDETPLAPEIEEFIKAGAPPLYFGFGSMSDPRPDETRALVEDCARALDRRFIFAPGLAARDLKNSSRVLIVGDSAHRMLFPRLAAVVHHGGAGTTATALRAAAPQLIIPHLSDQYFNGACVHRAGLGARPLPRSKLTAGRLARTLRRLLADDRVRSRATRAATELAGQDGVAQAVAFAESLVARGPESAPRNA